MYKTFHKHLHRFLVMLLTVTGVSYGYGGDSKEAASSSSIAALKYKIAQQDERISGLTTIIEGLSVSLNQLRQKEKQSLMLQDRVTQQGTLLEKLTLVVDNMSESYVSKEALQKILVEYSHNKNTVKTSNKTDFKNKENTTLYSEGVRHFGKQRYDEAKERFIVTEQNKYKPAASNFYLGEIAYYTKHYEDAIYHFKKSAGLYDQASYIDTLLFHTAVSLEKTGDKKQAKVFYENIIENYSDQKTAEISKKRLKNL